jgi:hypothetical protein
MARHYLPSLKDTKAIAPMGEKLADIFLKSALMERHHGFQEWTTNDAKEMGPGALLLWRRMAIFGGHNPAKVSIGAAFVVVMQIEVPGDAVLWAFTLNRLWNQGGPVDLEALATAFPDGFPTERGKEEIWDAQKCSDWGEEPSNDNMLDHPEFLTDTENFIEKKEWCKWLVT